MYTKWLLPRSCRLVAVIIFTVLALSACSSSNPSSVDNKIDKEQSTTSTIPSSPAANAGTDDSGKSSSTIQPSQSPDAAKNGQTGDDDQPDPQPTSQAVPPGESSSPKASSPAASSPAVSSPIKTSPTKTSPPKSSPQPQGASTKPPAADKAAASPKPAKTAEKTDDKKQVVTLSIKGDEEHGVILDAAELAIDDEISVISLLQKLTREKKIQMEFTGRGAASYVKGIDNLYEYDKGAKSGWLFRVNGVFSDKGAGVYEVKPGDVVDWLYTLDLGKDVGAKP
ncbi:DUF4430 domain-containing protein [Paenibacillus eucommiae]|uniref:Transcobalamin-like C-terminal domain-containing protein n=1 Tax=Paenibacillus eucommiae TaxID=1355755 RepID=A0ABS4INH3_9BACL|nr:DUF4430 domain-containing protein [Paenibacillus eucommiae]MBP1989123.1 hypothetical protein [Paenibacillus eucommiae]